MSSVQPLSRDIPILEASNTDKKFLLLSKHMTLDFIFSNFTLSLFYSLRSNICFSMTSQFSSAEPEQPNSESTAHFPQTFLLFLPTPLVKPLHEVTSSSLMPSLSTPSDIDAITAWLETSIVAKSQTLTQMSSIVESVQGSCFHQEALWELLIPQAETKTLQRRRERTGGSGHI